ncbi:MAG TPA: serine protease [Devosia sp.]|nr:serine protease [Devosia sp.]
MRLNRTAFALTIITASISLAQAQSEDGAGSPFSSVPTERAAQAAVEGTDRVFGGQDAAEGQFPFQVALLNAGTLTDDPQSQYESQFCGGTLIAAEWVLTAAHCMMDGGEVISPESVAVLAGTNDLQAGTRVLGRQIFVHEDYDETSMDHDVALIRLASAVTIMPVSLGYDEAAAGNAVIAGWGLTETGEYPRYLQTTDIELVNNEACATGIKAIYAADLKATVESLAQRYKISGEDVARIGDELVRSMGEPLTPAMLCAGLKSGARDTCYGDSGGPLLVQRGGSYLQLGIVSWGEGPAEAEIKCGNANVYGVYSRVASFRDWIQSHIGQP